MVERILSRQILIDGDTVPIIGEGPTLPLEDSTCWKIPQSQRYRGERCDMGEPRIIAETLYEREVLTGASTAELKSTVKAKFAGFAEIAGSLKTGQNRGFREFRDTREKSPCLVMIDAP